MAASVPSEVSVWESDSLPIGWVVRFRFAVGTTQPYLCLCPCLSASFRRLCCSASPGSRCRQPSDPKAPFRCSALSRLALLDAGGLASRRRSRRRSGVAVSLAAGSQLVPAVSTCFDCPNPNSFRRFRPVPEVSTCFVRRSGADRVPRLMIPPRAPEIFSATAHCSPLSTSRGCGT